MVEGEGVGVEVGGIRVWVAGCLEVGDESVELIEELHVVHLLALVDASRTALLAVGDAVEGVEQEAEFPGGADVSVVQVWVGGVELAQGVDQVVGGEGLDDGVLVGVEVSEVLGDGRVGAAHLVGDLAEGESLAAEVVGVEESGSSSGVHGGWSCLGVGWVMRLMVCE